MTDPTLFANPATTASPGVDVVDETGLVEIRAGGGAAAAIPGVVATGAEVEVPAGVRSAAVGSWDGAVLEATRAGAPVAGDGPRGGARWAATELDVAAARGGVAAAADVQTAEGVFRGANGTDGAAAVNGARLRPRSRGACDRDDAGGGDAAANSVPPRP